MVDRRSSKISESPKHNSTQESVPKSDSHGLASSATLRVAPNILLDSAGEKVAILGSSLLVHLDVKLTLNGVLSIERAFEEISQTHAWITYLSVIPQGARGVDSAAQERMAKAIAKYTKRIAAAAIVYEGSGFRATAVRSIITAIHWASRATHPLHVCERLEPALTWLKHAPHTEGVDFAELGSVMRKLRVPDN